MLQQSEETCSQPCNLCGSTQISVLASASRSGNPLRTVICQECGLVWSDPLPHDPRRFYEEDYRVAYKGTFTPKPKHIIRAGEAALSRRQTLGKYIEHPKKILDVGTGGGEFAYLLKTLGHDVSGIEPNKGYCEYSQNEYGLAIQNGFIQDIQQSENSFELITIWHVLEHTENPTAVMAKLYNLLQARGVLVVEVPSIEATCQSPHSTFHEAHIYNFNLATLQKLGEKTGFTIVDHNFSSDGGNMTVFFHKILPKQAEKNLSIQGNAEKIIQIVSGHTTIKHYLTFQPYCRFLNRMVRSLREKLAANNGVVSGKVILDKLYR